MSDSSAQGSIPSGWYPDPSGAPGSRWWDGRAWTDTVGPPLSRWNDPANHRPQLDPGVPVYTIFIWLIVLLPLLGIPLGFAYTPHLVIERIGPENVKTVNPASIFTPGYFVTLGISLVFYGITVVLAFFDRRQLLRRGVVRPFHWAWTFLYSPAYVIGRSVIVHRVAPKRGLWPVWVYIAVAVVSLVVSGIRFAGLFGSLYS